MGQTASSFPFDIGKEVRDSCYLDKTYWKLYDGRSKADGSPVSIFAVEKRTVNPHRLLAAQNALQRLKTLRHPNILRFIEGVDLPDTVYIVTEHVEPLNLEAPDLVSPVALSLGLRQLVTAIGFLNNDCKMVHANVCPTSVFVNECGDWKLGGFDIVYPHAQPPPEVTRQNADVLPPQYRCPELTERQWHVIEKSEPWSVDSWSLGCFVYAAFNGGQFSTQNQLKRVQRIDPQLRPMYGRLLSTASRGRLNPTAVLESSFFANPVTQGVEFLEQLPMKSELEKQAFFANFGAHLDEYPPRCLKYKMLPELSKALEFGSASTLFSVVFALLLKIGATLTGEEYRRTLVPCITKLFSINERAVRIGLLKNLAAYAPYLDATAVNEHIWPKVVSGFNDTSSVLREVTLKSVPLFLTHMLPATINGALLGFLAKLQTDAEPAIRTNTTYCLAKISTHMSEATRKKVLASGFSRALKDPFAPARLAGLTCFMHSVQYFDADVIARRIIPTVSPFCIESDGDVRAAAIKCIGAFVDRLREASSAMTDAANINGSGATAAASGGAVNGGSSGGGGMLGGFGSMVMTSLKSKVYGSGGDDGGGGGGGDSGGGRPATSHVGTIDRSKFQPAHTPAPAAAATATPAPAAAATAAAKHSTVHSSAVNKVKATAKDSWNDDFFGDFDDDGGSSSSSSSSRRGGGGGGGGKSSATPTVAMELGAGMGGGGGAKRTPKERRARSTSNSGKKAMSSATAAAAAVAASPSSLVAAEITSNDNMFGDWDSFMVGGGTDDKQVVDVVAATAAGDGGGDDTWGDLLSDLDSGTSPKTAAKTKTKPRPTKTKPTATPTSVRSPVAARTATVAARKDDPFAGLEGDWTSGGGSKKPPKAAAHVTLTPSSFTSSNKTTTRKPASKPSAAAAADDDWASFLNS